MKENEIHFIDRTIKHIRRVQDNMILLEKNRYELPFGTVLRKWELLNRSMSHDISKFSKKLIEDYIKTTTYFRCKRLNLECEIEEKDLKRCWKKHEDIERHHPERKKKMSLIDLCEMCCDISAISQELNEKDYTKYFKEVLIKEVPMLEKYRFECIKILKLLQELNTKKD